MPLTADGRGDLALLVLDQAVPDGVIPANLGRFGEPDARTLRTFGHPPGAEVGVRAQVRPVGYGGPASEWVQLEGLPGRQAERGFSGAGVFDNDAAAVVGLLMTYGRDQSNSTAWMLPVERVVQYLNMLTPLVGTEYPRRPEG